MHEIRLECIRIHQEKQADIVQNTVSMNEAVYNDLRAASPVKNNISPAHDQVHNNLTYTAYTIYIHTPTCVRIFWTPVHMQGSSTNRAATPLPPSALNGVSQIIWPVHMSTRTSCS